MNRRNEDEESRMRYRKGIGVCHEGRPSHEACRLALRA